MDYVKKILKTLNPVALVAEMLGTFTLVFVVLAASKYAAGGLAIFQQASAAGDVQKAFPAVYLVSVPLMVSFALGISIMTLGKFSGGHFNPGVTFGMWTAKKIRTAAAVAYILVQLLGAFAAFGVMQLFVPEATALTFINADAWKIFAAEALGMFIFVFGIRAAIAQERSSLESGFMIGASLFLGLLFAGFVSGAGFLNPAIFMATVRESLGGLSLGPVFGPLVGATAGVWLYTLMEEPQSVKGLAKKPNLKQKKKKKKKK